MLFKCAGGCLTRLALLCFAENLAGGKGAHLVGRYFLQMPSKLADNFILKQIDDRVKISRLLLRSRRQSARFDSNFAVLPVFVNREDYVGFTCAFEELPQMREFPFRIATHR